MNYPDHKDSEPVPQEINTASSSGRDLPDNKHDEDRMQSEEVTLDLPDVSDIPGQEHVQVLPLGELADTTISSDDEEADYLFEDTDDETIVMGTADEPTAEDQQDLQTTDEDMPTEDENSLRQAALDNEDFDGEKINEAASGDAISGADLDTPTESAGETGEEDEENETYSLGDTE